MSQPTVAPACSGVTDCVEEPSPAPFFVPQPPPSTPAARIPSPPPPAPLTPLIGFPAAKYFSYIFFAVAITVILMFTLLILYHTLVRRRARRRRQNQGHAWGNGDAELGAPPEPIAMRKGILVTQPDGHVTVAYDPTSPSLQHPDGQGSPRRGDASDTTASDPTTHQHQQNEPSEASELEPQPGSSSVFEIGQPSEEAPGPSRAALQQQEAGAPSWASTTAVRQQNQH